MEDDIFFHVIGFIILGWFLWHAFKIILGLIFLTYSVLSEIFVACMKFLVDFVESTLDLIKWFVCLVGIIFLQLLIFPLWILKLIRVIENKEGRLHMAYNYLNVNKGSPRGFFRVLKEICFMPFKAIGFVLGSIEKRSTDEMVSYARRLGAEREGIDVYNFNECRAFLNSRSTKYID